MPAASAEGISVQKRNHKDSSKFKFNTPQKAILGKGELCQWKWATYCKFWWQRKGFHSSLSRMLAQFLLSCSAGENGWLVCLQQIHQLPPSEFLKQRLLHSLVKTVIGRMRGQADVYWRAKLYMTKILQKNIACAGIFLVQIRIIWTAFAKKFFHFVAFHLCNPQTRGRKELLRQTLPQKYKDRCLLGRTEIQKSRRQNWDSEVHPNLLCFFLLRTLSSQHTRDLSQLLWFSHSFWFSFSCFYSSQFSSFPLSSIP